MSTTSRRPRTTSPQTESRGRAAHANGKLRRGRPPKYGQPGQVVAVTLPQRVVRSLERVHSDLGWAIVTLVEKNAAAHLYDESILDVQLVEVGADEFLIVVSSAMFHNLPGVQLVPLSATQSFLAFEPGRGINDLAVACADRLEQLRGPSRERRAVAHLAAEVRRWRRDSQVTAESRGIIILSRARPHRR